jgi:hypothetical protein
MKELWKDCYMGLYEVSNLGRVRSVRSGKIKKPWGGDSYLIVGFCVDNVRKAEQVHTLVAREFIGPRPAGKEVNHKDTNKHNNRWDNLEYLTPSENQLHARRMGVGAVGERVTAFVKLTAKEVLQIRAKYKTGLYTHEVLGKMYDVTRTTVTYILQGKTWKHLLGDA